METIDKINQTKTMLQDYQKDLEKEFEDLFKNSKESSELLASIKYSVLNGGKRIRPILSLITAEAVLKKKEKLSLKENPGLGIALAVELVHCGSLIHDDLPCMDDDDLRRGKPSNHKKFGEATALLAGDFLMTFPHEVLLKKSTTKEALLNASLKLNKAVQAMINGQALDIEYTDSPKTIDFEELLKMQEQKTGALLKASVEIAALLAGAKKKELEALTLYAENLGKAFQIADDILDVTASTEELGKTSGKDQEQNKLTYVKEFGLEKSKEIAHSLIFEAKCRIEEVEIYSEKLNLIADYVISRTN